MNSLQDVIFQDHGPSMSSSLTNQDRNKAPISNIKPETDKKSALTFKKLFSNMSKSMKQGIRKIYKKHKEKDDFESDSSSFEDEEEEKTMSFPGGSSIG